MATIVAAIRNHPLLLVPGMLGFALRGGIVLLILPILVLPTSVEARLLLGGNLGSTGLTDGFYVLVAAISVVTLIAAVGALYVLARCELALFGRFVNSTEDNAEHAWPPPGRLPAAAASAVTARLFVVQALALLAVLLAAVPLAAAIAQSTYQEILLPSSAQSIYARIAADVAGPFAFWMVAIVLIEALSAMATRRVLARVFRLTPYVRIARHPARIVAVALVGWLAFVGGVALGMVGLTVTWDGVRTVFLSTGLSGDPASIAGAVVVALALGTVFATALLVCGLVSTFRAGLWTLASLR